MYPVVMPQAEGLSPVDDNQFYAHSITHILLLLAKSAAISSKIIGGQYFDPHLNRIEDKKFIRARFML